MAKTKRLMDIWLYINRKKKFTAQELSDTFQVSVRTIQRDLIDLTEMGVPFYAEVGRSGGYALLYGETLPPISFTEEETASIIFTYESLKQYQDIPYEAEIDSVIYKLLAQSSKQLKSKLSTIQKHIFMKIPFRIERAFFLKPIFQASITNRVLHFTYETGGKQKTKEVVPIGIYSENGYWYFPAYDLDNKHISLFRADRVNELTMKGRVDIELPDLQQWLAERAAAPIKDPREIVLRFDKRVLPMFANSFFDFSKILWEHEHTGVLRQIVSEEEFPYIASLLLPYGPEVEVLEPVELKNLLISKLHNTIAIYEKNP